MPSRKRLRRFGELADARLALVRDLDGTGIADDLKGPPFRTVGRGTGRLTCTPLPQADAYAVVRRRTAAAGIGTRIGTTVSGRRASPPA